MSEAASTARSEEAEFEVLFERHRRELHVHCYRMLGSLQDAEDLVQETFLNAWRNRHTFQRRSSFRTWLYRIATNACLNALRRNPRKLVPQQVAGPADPEVDPLPATDLPWLQPYPDRLLDELESGPEAATVSKETIELAFLAAIQHLPPRQRAVLILRDALDWSASETASLLDSSVASVNSALQRAHATLKEHLPQHRDDWSGRPDPGEEERLLRSYMDAWERRDAGGLASLLREDAHVTMPPIPTWYQGRDAIARIFERHVFAPGRGEFRSVPTRANRQPAFGIYRKLPGEPTFMPRVLEVLRVDGNRIGAIEAFVYPELFPTFGLPSSL
jgi:RNA polymerase sigma-70 factor, ECF subfamily